MIPRLLVPEKLSPVPAAPADGRRRAWTFLDDRLVIPAELPVKALEVQTNIPLHVPLGVLGERILIPREAVPGRLELPPPGEHLLPTDADERMAVPVDARPRELVSESVHPIEVLEQEDLVTSDVFTSGQVRLMPKQVSEPSRDWTWIVPTGSLVFHIILVAALFSFALLFPHREPTQEELEAASKQLGIVYLPNSMYNQPKSTPRPAAPSDKLRVDPGMIKKLSPEIMPSPSPQAPPQVVAPRPQRELPNAPVPQTQQPSFTPPERAQSPQIETPKPVPDAPTPAFQMPNVSPGRALQDSLRGAATRGPTPPVTFGGSMPHGGGGGVNGGGGAGDGYLGGGLMMLTPDQGVDFSGYLARVVASTKRYWLTVMPESARMGDRGRVVIDFKIMRDGSVPLPEPLLKLTSGKEPLDRAALSSIRGASPFEPLPAAFNGPYIELRFIFLYNLPLDAAQ